MKNRFLRFLVIIVIITVSIFCLNKVLNVKADSGWDSDYDSGSSWDSDSDWDSDSSWDSDSDYDGSGGGTSISCDTTACKVVSIISFFLVLVLAFSPEIIIIILIIKFCKNANKGSNETYERITEQQILDVIPNFDIEEFEKTAYQIFYDTQMAWMEFDYDKLKEILTDELYNTYEMDLEALKIKNQKNIMKDFELIESKLFKLEEVNGRYIAKVLLEVKFIDFVEDSINNKVLRGSDTRKLHNTYILTFERSKKIKEDNICPKCSAPIEGNTTGICEYCKSKIMNDNYDWIMSKKEKISQK